MQFYLLLLQGMDLIPHTKEIIHTEGTENIWTWKGHNNIMQQKTASQSVDSIQY